MVVVQRSATEVLKAFLDSVSKMERVAARESESRPTPSGPSQAGDKAPERRAGESNSAVLQHR